MEVEEFLEHHGILGMKWGVRKGSLGVADMTTGRGIGTLASPGTALLSKKEVHKGAQAAEKVAASLLDRETGVLSPKGELRALNIKYAPTFPMKGKVLEAYDKEAASVLTEAARKHVPRGADAVVVVSPSEIMLYVGDKETVSKFREGVRHSYMGDTVFDILRDENGLIIGIKPTASVLQQNEAERNILIHYGVLGMKWGVRKGATFVKTGMATGDWGEVGKVSVGSYRPGDNTKSRLKGSGLNLIGSIPSAYVAPLATHWGHVKPVVDKQLKEINKRYSSMTLKRKLKPKYDAEVQSMIVHTFKTTVVKGLVAPSISNSVATRRGGDLQNAKYDFYTNGKTAFLRVTTNKSSADLRVGKFKHAEGDNTVSFEIPVTITYDADGFVVDISIPDLEEAEHMDSVEEFLAHHGILGMKWGVRRSSAQLAKGSSSPSSNGRPAWQSAPEHKAKPASTSSPAPHPSEATQTPQESKNKAVSNDAQELRDLRKKVKKYGAASLTNEDLQKIAKRVELQEKYNKAYPKKKSKTRILGELAVSAALSDVGSTKIVSIVGDKKNAAAADKVAEFLKNASEAKKLYDSNTKSNKKK